MGQQAFAVSTPTPRRRLAATAIALGLVAAVPARAQEAPVPLSVWTYSLYKTVTYELAANLADIPLYYRVLGGVAAAGAGLFTVVNVATAAGAYYVHEVAWNIYGPPMQESTATAVEVGLEKMVLYRVVSTARNVVLAYAVTGNPWATFGFVMINNVTDAVIYLGNEYAWYAYGPPVAIAPPDATIPVATACTPGIPGDLMQHVLACAD